MKTFKLWQETTSTSAVPGAGDDSSTVIMRKTGDRKRKRKDVTPLLTRIIQNKEKKV
jgi:hypothetical protein